MSLPNLWAIVDLSDNTVLMCYPSLDDARKDLLFMRSTMPFKRSVFHVTCSDGFVGDIPVGGFSDLGILFYRPQGACPISDDAAEKAK